jgi:hypothetical protein
MADLYLRVPAPGSGEFYVSLVLSSGPSRRRLHEMSNPDPISHSFRRVVVYALYSVVLYSWFLGMVTVVVI